MRVAPFVPGEDPVCPGDRLDFACQGCGGCCTDTTPYLTPYDVWRLARHLGLTTGEILDRTALVRPEDGGAPLLQLILAGENGECVFLAPAARLCLVYPARPLSCRAFPLGLRHEADGDRLTKAHTLPECRGEGRGRQTAGEYLEAQLDAEERRWSRAYAGLAREIFPPGGRRSEDPEYVSYYLRTCFDLDALAGEGFADRFAEAAYRLRRAAALAGDETVS